jgi:hypothetical protein
MSDDTAGELVGDTLWLAADTTEHFLKDLADGRLKIDDLGSTRVGLEILVKELRSLHSALNTPPGWWDPPPSLPTGG